ncbi:LamG-like jellyroll fold domain-containing protein [Nonomuraea soli]|uniref:Type 1 glutamine amidotransferase n=1 Tax=Nonomuraea soli TaxID=1032476 RepID=A0A7W0CF71_9ACTN|nr:LamG-like jellyroll fold domain-containing protein [Nonomuraea soli]MBA2890076.1 type 1 glutamine amidotransferase [Nonomuraea soli]
MLLVAAALTAVPAPAFAAPDTDGQLRILLFYKPNFHASNVQARQAVRDLATQLGAQYNQPVDIQETDDPAAFTTANLAVRDAVVFAQTGGVLFDAAQRAALESYIRGGGGFMGLHYTGWSVGQSEHDVNPFYARLVGAVSEGHPENPGVRPGRVFVTDSGHPLVQGVTASITRSDEWYDWVVNPAPSVRTLIQADESSYGMGRQGSSHPITWCQQIDSGRSWYTAMGHEGTAYAEPYMLAQMKNGLAYATKLLPADCTPPVKDQAGAWSGVTPWPLVPINMSLTSDGRVQSFGSVGGWLTDATPYDWTGNDTVTQGGQMEIDIWNPAQPRTLSNVNSGLIPNTTYTDLFCAMQVQNPHDHSTMTVGGDDGMGGNSPNDGAIGVTGYTTNNGLQNKAPLNFPRWYPTGTTMPDGSVVVQGGSLTGGPGGRGVLTPEIYTPMAGSGWKKLDGARSPAAYGDGGADHAGADENRWWYPRAFVAPTTGTLFNITGTQMYELNPAGTGQLTLRGTLPANIANQGVNGNPVGATSTATMFRPGKILQVGGGWWGNGGGPDGARAGFVIDITGGTANPVITATQPMKYQRHWATSTLLPDGRVLVTGGSRVNNGNDGYVTNPEIWDPATGAWTEVVLPHEHARLYHSTALLLPDGRVMVGGGGTPGPRNYTDVEYYSPGYLFNGNAAAPRPVISAAPQKVGYNGTFQVTSTGTISRVTLVRNGSVTHGFNNDQNFQDLTFSQSGSTVNITSPLNGNYAPPGSYMLFVWDNTGTPSVAKVLQIDPAVVMTQLNPRVVDQFEYPRLPAEWRTNNPPATVDVAAGNTRMVPWNVVSQVQLVRGNSTGQGGLGFTGYQLALGTSGSIQRTVSDLTPGTSYRVSLRHARDARSAGTAPSTATLSISGLSVTLTSTTAQPSTAAYATYSGTFTAATASQQLTLAATAGTGAGTMIDDLVIVGDNPPPPTTGIPIHYEFEEGTGTAAANTGTLASAGPAVLTGTTGWSANGVLGKAVNLPGGSTANAVDLPDNLLLGATNFSTSLWVRPDAKNNWTGLFHIGDGLGSAGSYYQIQMQTQASGSTGLAVTFKGKTGPEERVYSTPARDVVANQWNHIAFTRQGPIGTLYLNGEVIATRTNFTVGMTEVGPTTNNWLGRNGYPDAAYDGLIDDVRLYTSTLTTADIAAMYNEGVSIRHTFDEGSGTTAANTGTKATIGAATLQGTTSWSPTGQYGGALSLPGGAASTGNQVRLADNIEAGLTNQFTVSFWARPDTLPNWVPLVQIGSSTDTFFLLQSATNGGTTGFGATFKEPGIATQERLLLGSGRDLPLGAWTHVVFTMNGSTGKIYFNGVLQATRNDFTITIGEVGVGGNTAANYIGGTSWGDDRFDGLIDDFRLYSYELSADHVTRLYQGRG